MLTEIFKRPLNTVQARGIPRDGCQNDLVCLRNVERRFDHSDIAAVDHVDLCVHSGEILAILGPSGSGKSTLLRLIAGFEKPDFGSVLINHSVASNSSKVVPPESRGIGIVFQDYALFPHLSVFDNIAFGLKGKLQIQDKKSRVDELVQLMGLMGLEKRYPSQLSGGQQQRVALARALAPQPVAIMLDEPFSNLDYNMRKEMRKDLSRILHACNTTAVLVTHDREEAMSIADRIAVLHEGKLLQVDTPLELYNNPCSPIVAGLLGSANFIEGILKGSYVQTELGMLSVSLRQLGSLADGDRVNVLLRPEHLSVEKSTSGNSTVLDVDYNASQFLYEVVIGSGSKLLVAAPVSLGITCGDSLKVMVEPGHELKMFPLMCARTKAL